MRPSPRLAVLAVPVGETLTASDDLSNCLATALDDAAITLQPGDVVVVASKVVALTEDATITSPTPPGRAHQAGSTPRGDPRRAAAAASADRIVADDVRALIVATPHGFVCANAGIDASNIDGGLLALPEDPDASARRLRTRIRDVLGVTVGVIVSDTFGRPWRMGQTDVALGIAGTPALRDERGGHDLHGRRLDVTLVAVADEVAAAADLVRSKANGVPFVIVRGLSDDAPEGTGTDLVRPVDQDLFPAGGPTLFDHAVSSRVLADPAWPVAAASPRLLAALHHAGDLAARPGCRTTVIEGATPGIAISADSAVLAGMVAEAATIVLAGRDIPTRVVETTGTPGATGTDVTVIPVADPDRGGA